MSKTQTKILVVEDDPNLGTILADYLRAKGFDTTLKVNGVEGIQAYKSGSFELLILDVMMPLKDGFTVAKEVRVMDKSIPIIFLTAKSMKEDAITGFEIGADDYISKPFSMELLLARINAVLRRTKILEDDFNKDAPIEVGMFKLDPVTRKLASPDGEHKLTSKECELLRLLHARKNEILDRSEALLAIWGDDSYFNSRSMDVYMSKIRKYLRPDERIEIINVHGKGFRLTVMPI